MDVQISPGKIACGLIYYAENWTMMGDLQILFRTFKAVVGSDGAY